jgi:hypothetical protein
MLATSPHVAFAQQPTPVTLQQSPATGKNLEITVGGAFLTPVPMGSQNISLIAPGGGPFNIADTTSRTGASFGVEARLGFRMSNRTRLEVAGGWSRVGFETEVSGDIEDAESIVASLPVNRFTAGGAVTFSLSSKPKRDIYAIAGASWMRELSEISATGVYDDGAIVDGGAGMKLWWRDRPSGRIKRLGLRVEGRVGVRTGGLALDDKSAHIVPAFIASLIIGS